ncbi:ribose-phosphate pyrophosphokinase [Desulfonatronospira thiodismutans ASO3-1]|uniref:Ribose-phosphate pyrophosphokinase n=1 Tax=Desulfonatronospira thiodismutans ASO3-1 TaxID=555779 RepID=D6SSI2_9BACT|nr:MULTISPECIES: ribose-phosphate diphosphokinase [Desulfonatronospira]EFI33648.1 ribose-phosphate pyrophosphokinase [Desulfonatronospira thiodismutans ASO3-1]RQD74766.1 MAG: ribose-phosphate diphosphokinase [Desulfonatronospira sp. MSAO_Bac3]
MIKVFCCPQMHDLARKICKASEACESGEISWNYFQDGFPNLMVHDAIGLRNSHVVFLASMDSPAEIFSQLSVIYELPRLAVKSLKVIMPYFPTGTMERVDEEGEIATAATLARMLSLVPGTMTGPVQIIIYDIHALQERFYFSDQVVPRLETAVPLLLERIQGMPDVAVAFPDEGAWKRFGRMFEGYPLITAHKVRDKDGRRVIIREGEPRGRNVIVVDDLVMTGGTLIKCRQALEEAGAKSVSAYVTHGVFPQKSWERFIDQGFERFWLTDSCPETARQVDGTDPFEVLSLAGDISRKLVT